MRAKTLFPVLLLLALPLLAANDVPVPQTCNPTVNARLSELLHSGTKRQVDNVMVCGVATEDSRTQPGGPHGGHQVISIQAHFPDGSSKLVEVVTNDALDGVVRAHSHEEVFAYGQAFFDRTGRYIAGVHDVHCSTHNGADNGWVVVAGNRFPAGTCAVRGSRRRR